MHPQKSTIINFIIRFWRSGIYLAFTLYMFTHNFKSAQGRHIPHFDKVVHLGIFFIFTFVMMYDRNRKISAEKISGMWLIIALQLLYGIAIEVAQSLFIPHRSGSLHDVIYDAIGALFGLYVFVLYKNSKLCKSAV